MSFSTIASAILSISDLVPDEKRPTKIHSGKLSMPPTEGFALNDNILIIQAPKDVPVQISWLSPTEPIVPGGSPLSLVSVTYKWGAQAPSSPPPLHQLYPLKINSTRDTLVAFLNQAGTLYYMPPPFSTAPAAPAVSSVFVNTLEDPPRIGGRWQIDYTLIFHDECGTIYTWDPAEDIEHACRRGSIHFSGHDIPVFKGTGSPA